MSPYAKRNIIHKLNAMELDSVLNSRDAIIYDAELAQEEKDFYLSAINARISDINEEQNMPHMGVADALVVCSDLYDF